MRSLFDSIDGRAVEVEQVVNQVDGQLGGWRDCCLEKEKWWIATDGWSCGWIAGFAGRSKACEHLWRYLCVALCAGVSCEVLSRFSNLAKLPSYIGGVRLKLGQLGFLPAIRCHPVSFGNPTPDWGCWSNPLPGATLCNT